LVIVDGLLILLFEQETSAEQSAAVTMDE